MLERLEGRGEGLWVVVEWDEETGEVGVGQGMRTGRERAEAYERVGALQGFLRRSGVEWVDEGLVEHWRGGVCGMGKVAVLAWRARTVEREKSRMVADAIRVALGGE
jgi:hypothetical protein